MENPRQFLTLIISQFIIYYTLQVHVTLGARTMISSEMWTMEFSTMSAISNWSWIEPLWQWEFLRILTHLIYYSYDETIIIGNSNYIQYVRPKHLLWTAKIVFTSRITFFNDKNRYTRAFFHLVISYKNGSSEYMKSICCSFT